MSTFNDPWSTTPKSRSNRPGANWVQEDDIKNTVKKASGVLNELKSKIGELKVITIVLNDKLTMECVAIDEEKFNENVEYLKVNGITGLDFSKKMYINNKIYIKKLCQVYNFKNRSKVYFTPNDIVKCIKKLNDVIFEK